MTVASTQQEQDEYSSNAEERYERFIQWTRQHGAYFHPSLTFVVTPNRGAEVLVTGQAIQPFETLFKVPYGISLSYFNAVSAGIPGSPYQPHSKPLPEEFLENTSDHDTVNAIFLVQQYLLGEQSFWYPYIQILPQPDDDKDSAIPLLWPESDLLWLRGTHLEEAVSKQKVDHVKRWTEAMETLQKYGWDPSQFTLELGLWAYYCFYSRYFWSIILEPDVANIKPEFQHLVKAGMNLDDTAKILLPILETLNHAQETNTEYNLDDKGLSVSKNIELKPGDPFYIAYDKETQRFNNTVLLKDFGFILPDNEAAELVLSSPFDLTRPMHLDHCVFGSAATVDDPYWTSEDKYLSLLAVRSPSLDSRGPINPGYPVRWLRHFDPTFVSIVSLRVANLAERATLRLDPQKIPSERNEQATVQFISGCLHAMLGEIDQHRRALGEPQNERQRRADAYRLEQKSILEEVLQDLYRDGP
ncbi:uncharacterized protein NECHADRAFT_106552 [Fusarium vanettenii 77-13-4]|uniref:SET domain-containing protein n=1 Tax=Fusarium vanettenii (strain ATCC MYA-4622 / CBS 123669 / FGSC 9596 / NRRL 45880 / 77-13-4) TaxID=660122 RepID=C7Z3D8_FUSV7|nr:uncharacterized protein NECHADRAFT_106552 [Fusarium vanettenii 77-13-4]EEU41637.1 hypothetical protein NECHADRAFT_106552 [Fusarium vanettenii 77-13-4]